MRRRRATAAVALIGVVAVAAMLVARAVSGGGTGQPSLLVPRAEPPASDPLAYDGDDDVLERAAAFGLGHPLYVKSPGGVVASARRTAAYRTLVEDAARGSDVDPDVLEAMVFLESGGRPEVIAGDDPARASGLAQILAETAQHFLGMNVDLARSRKLTSRIARAKARGDAAGVARLRAERRRIDDRFDPAKALSGAARYLTTARERFGRDDLAVVSYHMGIGTLTNVLRAYARAPGATARDLVAEHGLSWARVFFDTTPARNVQAFALLRRLGDDSPTYYWRVLAAREIMRLYRDDPDELMRLAVLHRAKASAEEVLHPPTETERFVDSDDVLHAWEAHVVQPLPADPAAHGLRIDPRMGELADRLGVPRGLYRGLRPEALATLLYIGRQVRSLSGASSPLTVTSTVRDDSYQGLLRRGNVEATAGYSLHTTGYAFDILRRYAPGQAPAFQFLLDRLTALGLVAWVREPAAIHITVSSDAARLVPVLLEPAPGSTR